MLVPLFVGLFFTAAVEQGHPASGKAGMAALVAVLKDPLSLFADRSPGGRGAGALLSTKPGYGPEERVLSGVRERDPAFGEPPLGALPAFDDPAFAALPGAPGSGTPGAGGAPGDSFGGGPGGPFGGGPFGAPFSGFSDPEPSGPGGRPFIPPVPPPDGGVSAIPEPATWAVMILGFFAVGTAARRRGRKIALTSLS